MDRIGFVLTLAVLIITAVVACGLAGWYPAGQGVTPQASRAVQRGPDAHTTTVSSAFDMSKWTLYRNAQYGFEVKYPNELVADFDHNEWMSGSDLVGKRSFNILITHPTLEPSVPVPRGDGSPIGSGYAYGGYNFAVFSGDAAKSQLEVKDNLVTAIHAASETIVIDGMPGVLYSAPVETYSSQSPRGMLYFASFPLQDNDTMIVDTGVVDDNYDKQTLMQILSTLHFTWSAQSRQDGP